MAKSFLDYRNVVIYPLYLNCHEKEKDYLASHSRYEEIFKKYLQLRILEIHTIGAAFVLHYVPYNRSYILQGRNDGENLGATAPMVGRICPPGWNMVKISET